MILLIIRNESNNKPAKLIHFEVSVVKLEDSAIQIKVIITAAAAGLARPIKYFLSCAWLLELNLANLIAADAI